MLFIKVTETSKPVLNTKKLGLLAGVLFTSLFTYGRFTQEKENLAIIITSFKAQASFERFSKKPHDNSKLQGGITKGSKPKKRTRAKNTTPPPAIKLMAKQIITRDDLPVKSKLSTGTNLIGKLISRISTKDPLGSVRVLLPYGSKDGTLPKNTLLLGKASYPGSGKRVYITLNKAVLPDGKELNLQASALDTRDYSSGVLGHYHSQRGSQVARTLSLSMISGMTEVLTKKESLSDGGAITPESSMENALYHGVSKVSDMEASRQASQLNNLKGYVTLEPGKDLIVSLLSPIN